MENFLKDFLGEISVRAKNPRQNPRENLCRKSVQKVRAKNPCKKTVQNIRAKIRAEIRAKQVHANGFVLAT